MPHFIPNPDRPLCYQDICQHISDRASEKTVFFKDMSYYVVPQIFADPAFHSRLTNLFLIRDPHLSIPSYFKLDNEVTSEEIGLEALYKHVKWIIDTTGVAPLILDSEHIQADAVGALQQIWEYTGLESMDTATSWRTSNPDQWQEVEGWHQAVLHSRGIRPPAQNTDYQTEFQRLADKHSHLHDYLNQHLPYYEKLKGLASAQQLNEQALSHPPG